MTLAALINGVKADPGLKADTLATHITKGAAAAGLMNDVLLDMIAQTKVNADGWISAADMQKISDALWMRANAAPWRDFWIGHGNDNGDVETGFHYVQNDGATLQFQGRNFVDTVADAIYHYGFRIRDGRYFNEDGNSNETIKDVAGWLNYFLNGENMVFGSGGADELGSGVYSNYFAKARNETFRAGDGDDAIWADRGNDKVYGGDGNDRSGGGTGLDRMYGENGHDTLWGDGADDRLYGGDGRDELGGGDGRDHLNGGAMADALYGDAGGDVLAGNAGWDSLMGGDGADRLEGGGGNDDVSGGDGADWVLGDAGADALSGGEGQDFLRGGAGADVINLWESVSARDRLYLAAGDSGKTLATMDKVEGFISGVDKIDLSALGPMRFQGLDYAGGGQASCYFDGDYLRIDRGGDGATDMMVEFVWVDDLRAGDFIFA